MEPLSKWEGVCRQGSRRSPRPGEVRGRRGRWAGERGGGLILAIMLVVLVPLLLAVAYQTVSSHGSQIELEHSYRAQAISIAQAGLVDALSWFRRQTGQPVAVFNPKLDLLATPPIIETDLPALGIVRSFVLSGETRRWGRYVVDKNFCRDVTAERGLTGAGVVWYLQSTGILFESDPADDTVRWMTTPPGILLRVNIATEIRRMAMTLSLDAAVLCGAGGAAVTVGLRGRVAGGTRGYGVGYKNGTGTPTVTGEVTGIERLKPVDPASFDTSIQGVFAVSREELFSMADLSVGTVEDLPNPYPAMALVCIEGDATFDAHRPLTGGGVLFVTGNLAVSGSSSFAGFIFVEGNYTQRSTAVVYGCIVANGTVDIAGTGGDFTETFYDGGALEVTKQMLGRYRISKAPHIVEMNCGYCAAQGVHTLYSCTTCRRVFCERDCTDGLCPNCGAIEWDVLYRY